MRLDLLSFAGEGYVYELLVKFEIAQGTDDVTLEVVPLEAVVVTVWSGGHDDEVFKGVSKG